MTTRARVVEEARLWLRTPYHHKAAVKGAGVDCAQILAEVYFAAGMLPTRPDLGDYPSDWMLHREEERYLAGIYQYGHEVKDAKPGDVIVWKFGRCFSHGAIVVNYPTIIHAYRRAGMVVMDSAESDEFAGRERKIFTFWES